MTSVLAGASVDDFVSGAGAATRTGERLEAIGLGASLAGTVVATGIVAYLAWVHRGAVREVTVLLRLVVGAGVAMVAGAAIEVAGTARILDAPWSTTLTDGSASAAMLRLLAGLLVVLGLLEETLAVGGLAGQPMTAGPDGGRQWFPSAGSSFALVGLALGVLSFGFDGHTVTEGPRLVHAAVDVVHVTAGAVWFGGVAGLLVTAVLRRGTDAPSIAALFLRFSRLATIALGVVVAAGVAMAWMILDGPDELTGTPWGRRLLVKLGAVVAAMLLGAYNHLALAPRLARGDAGAERSARTSIALETMVLSFVVVATAFLVRSSTN